MLDGIAADMREICPDAWLLNYTNPMAMNVTYLGAVAPDLKVVGLCHSVYWTVRGLCELIGVPFDEVDYTAAGRQPPGVAAAVGAPTARTSTRGWTSASRADPELRRRVRVDMYRRLGFYPDRDQRALRPSTCRGTCTTTPRSTGCASRSATTCRSARTTWPSTRRPAPRWPPASRWTSSRDATEYAPQVIHCMETGTMRRIHGNVVNTGLITNLPVGLRRRGAVRGRSAGRTPGVRRATCRSQCAAVNRGFVSVGELTVRAAVTGDPRMVRRPPWSTRTPPPR